MSDEKVADLKSFEVSLKVNPLEPLTTFFLIVMMRIQAFAGEIAWLFIGAFPLRILLFFYTEERGTSDSAPIVVVDE